MANSDEVGQGPGGIGSATKGAVAIYVWVPTTNPGPPSYFVNGHHLVYTGILQVLSLTKIRSDQHHYF